MIPLGECCVLRRAGFRDRAPNRQSLSRFSHVVHPKDVSASLNRREGGSQRTGQALFRLLAATQPADKACETPRSLAHTQASHIHPVWQ